MLNQHSVRQAKLGISYRVEVPVGQGLTSHPYRVLRVLRRESMTTEQDIRSVHRESCGPQERPHSPKQFSLVTLRSSRRRCRCSGSLHEGIVTVRSWRDCRGRRAWHAGREMPGTWEAPWVPSERVRWTNPQRRPPDGPWGVRSLHSTLRR